MKRILTIACAMLVLGCATAAKKQNHAADAQNKKTPLYFAGGESVGAWRARVLFKEMRFDGALLIQQLSSGAFNVKIMGPMGSRLADGVYADGKMKFDYIFPDFDSNAVKARLEKFIALLILPPGETLRVKNRGEGIIEVFRTAPTGGRRKYSYKDENIYPHALALGGMVIDYSDYRARGEEEADAVPYVLAAKDSLSGMMIELSLLNLR